MSGLLSPHEKEPPRHGLLLLQLLILGVFCVFTLRFWYLQVHEGQEFARKAKANQLRREYIYAPRGLIRARGGELLATNEPAYALGLVREDCHDVEATLDAVSRWTGLERAKLDEIYRKGRGKVKPFEPLILSQDLGFEEVAEVEAHKLRWPGLEILVRSRRNYTHGDLFCHVLGYVAEANESELDNDEGLSLGDNVGKLGLEKILETRLRGIKGVREFEVDVTGRRMAEVNSLPPNAGQDVTLSIDLELQQRVQQAMLGKEGVVVVMDADSGQVLALVSAPSFDANHFTGGISPEEWRKLSDDPQHPLLNRVTQSAYPPGSVFKLVMAGCGLKEEMLNPSETVFCQGSLSLGSHVFRCWRRGGHGTVNLRRALVESCDVYFYKLGMKLGVDRISAFAFACGFGKPTGIDLPHEKGGNIPTREWKLKTFGERWQKGEDLNFAIGQGYTLVTPLQVARYISALINGGRLLKPQLLLDAEPEVQTQIPLDEKQRGLIKEAMIHTVEDAAGTCHRARTPGAVVGAKTGTAQVARFTDELKALKDNDIPYKLRDHAWMAGFGEKNGRRYAVVAMVEHGLHGGSGAGPLVRVCMDYLFPQNAKGAGN